MTKNGIMKTLSTMFSKQSIFILGLVVVALAIPITIFFSEKPQDPRQRAAENKPSVDLFFTKPGSNVVLTDVNFPPGQQSSIDLYLKTGETQVNGFEVSMEFGQGISVPTSGIVQGASASKFETLAIDKADNAARTITLARVTTQSPAPKGIFHLATITLNATTSAGVNGTISFKKALITREGGTTTVTKPTLTYRTSGEASSDAGTGTRLTVALGLQGVGGIEFANTTILQNLPTVTPASGIIVPKHPERDITVEVINPVTNETVVEKAGKITYNPGTRVFEGVVPLTETLPAQVSLYTVKIKTNQYLRKQFSSQTILPDRATVIPRAVLTVGDANNDNFINVLDYNIISFVCFGNKAASDASCSAADLNDDGKVDILDANLMFSNLAAREGD